MKNFIIITILLFSYHSIFSQVIDSLTYIRGVIIEDEIEGSPVSSVKIISYDTQNDCETTGDGKFSLNVKGRDLNNLQSVELSFYKQGYERIVDIFPINAKGSIGEVKLTRLKKGFYITILDGSTGKELFRKINPICYNKNGAFEIRHIDVGLYFVDASLESDLTLRITSEDYENFTRTLTRELINSNIEIENILVPKKGKNVFKGTLNHIILPQLAFIEKNREPLAVFSFAYEYLPLGFRFYSLYSKGVYEDRAKNEFDNVLKQKNEDKARDWQTYGQWAFLTFGVMHLLDIGLSFIPNKNERHYQAFYLPPNHQLPYGGIGIKLAIGNL